MAYTGRAASRIGASTCHSLLYTPVMDSMGNLIRWETKHATILREEVGVGIIVDESSMIPYDMHQDLSRIGVPIVYVGDFHQLPPVDNNNPFNVMEDLKDAPHITMTKMRRFSAESGIGEVAGRLREENTIPRMKRDDLRMVPRQATLKPKFFEDNQIDAVICGTNKTRKKYNEVIRKYRGVAQYDLPQPGEIVMCLRNDIIANCRINNGELFEVVMSIPGKEISRFQLKNIETKEIADIQVANETWETEKPLPGQSREDKLGVFCFGYAMTCHKSQGSTIDNVLFVDENVSFFLDQRKFRYTAVTRAADMLYIAI